MKRTQGIVMSINEKGIVALGKDGVFYHLPPDHSIPLIGEEIDIPANLVKKKKPPFFIHNLRTWGIVAAVFLLVITSVLMIPNATEAAYVVALDINPSIEMYMSGEDLVRKVVPLDEEAKTLIEGMGIEGKNLGEAIQAITEKAEQAGYLTTSEAKVVATIIDWNQKIDLEAIEKKVEQHISKTGEENRILITSSDRKTLEAAHQEKLPVSKYKIAKQLEDEGIKFERSELSKESVGELLKKYNLDPKEIFKPADRVKDQAKEEKKEEKKDKKDKKNDRKDDARKDQDEDKRANDKEKGNGKRNDKGKNHSIDNDKNNQNVKDHANRDQDERNKWEHNVKDRERDKDRNQKDDHKVDEDDRKGNKNDRDDRNNRNDKDRNIRSDKNDKDDKYDKGNGKNGKDRDKQGNNKDRNENESKSFSNMSRSTFIFNRWMTNDKSH